MTHTMTAARIGVRNATPEDAEALADLIVFASEGLVHHVWAPLAGPGESLQEVGIRRARREEGDFSYRNAFLLQDGGGVAAGLVSYPLPERAEAVDPATLPPLFRPLQALEAQAAGSWYVNVLAAYPDRRGRGYGKILLEEADRRARDAGRRRLSIIVSDGNPGARRLYERHGFWEAAKRPMEKGDWRNPGENWVLMLKSLA